MSAALVFALIALNAVNGQAPAGSIIGRIVEAPVPARSVSSNLVPVAAGTSYYASNEAYEFEGDARRMSPTRRRPMRPPR